MEVSTLKELYLKVNKHVKTVYVVPLIRFNFPKTDYLYLLYKNLLNNSDISIQSISALNHFRFVLHVIFNRNILLHYHWLEFQDLKSLVGMPYKLLCIGLYKILGGKIIWTVHNLRPHDRKYLTLHRYIHKWMAKISSFLHVHAPSSIQEVSTYYEVSKTKIVVLKHPEFPAILLSKDKAQKDFLSLYGNGRANLQGPVFLIFGGISEYKGIRKIIELLTKTESQFTLIIAGYVKKGQEELHKFILSQTIDDSRLLYIPTFIPEEHYPLMMNSCDICLFNYHEILSSGGAEMARVYNKRIVAPNLGTLKEFRDSNNIFLFDSEEELETILMSELSPKAYG